MQASNSTRRVNLWENGPAMYCMESLDAWRRQETYTVESSCKGGIMDSEGRSSRTGLGTVVSTGRVRGMDMEYSRGPMERCIKDSFRRG